MQGVILAAGKGTRLRPVTEMRTKAMAPVAGKPIVARVMDLMAQNGIDDFVLVVSPDDADIRRYFAENAGPERTIRFVEQTERLGMAHALGLAAPLIRGDFLLSACDNLVPAGHVAALMDALRHAEIPGALSLLPVSPSQVSSTGIVELRDERVWRIVEKPTPEEAPSNIASLPLYAFSPRILAYLPEVQPSPRGEYELQDAIQMVIERDGPLAGVFASERIQLTNTSDLLALNRHYLQHENGALPVRAQNIGIETQLIPPVCIEEGVSIGAHCVIGPNVCIERGVHIGDHVHLRDAILLRDATVPPAQRVAEQVII